MFGFLETITGLEFLDFSQKLQIPFLKTPIEEARQIDIKYALSKGRVMLCGAMLKIRMPLVAPVNSNFYSPPPHTKPYPQKMEILCLSRVSIPRAYTHGENNIFSSSAMGLNVLVTLLLPGLYVRLRTWKLVLPPSVMLRTSFGCRLKGRKEANLAS